MLPTCLYLLWTLQHELGIRASPTEELEYSSHCSVLGCFKYTSSFYFFLSLFVENPGQARILEHDRSALQIHNYLDLELFMSVN